MSNITKTRNKVLATVIAGLISTSVFGATEGDEIDYNVKLVGTASGAAQATAVSCNTASATFSGSGVRDYGSADNASTDTYSDTLILLVSPI
ncbi:MAG: hypothetical protein P8M72_06155 [Gammaproteobacteria bacterium]|nr:hypothetical protein [Gammaproteobacteria bacterium]